MEYEDRLSRVVSMIHKYILDEELANDIINHSQGDIYWMITYLNRKKSTKFDREDEDFLAYLDNERCFTNNLNQKYLIIYYIEKVEYLLKKYIQDEDVLNKILSKYEYEKSGQVDFPSKFIMTVLVHHLDAIKSDDSDYDIYRKLCEYM